MKRLLNVLIVSANECNTEPLLKTVQEQPVNFFLADTIDRAWDLVMGISMDVIFCDETLRDGGYRDLLTTVRAEYKAARFVVLLKSCQREEHVEALRLGATNVFAGSYQPSGVEQILIRAERDITRKESAGIAASA